MHHVIDGTVAGHVLQPIHTTSIKGTQIRLS